MAKKYFWLKLKDDFFRDKRIKKMRRIAGGDTYTVIYLKMQLLSLKNEGILLYEGVEDSFYEEIALEIDEDVENVKVTILFLVNNGLLEEMNDNQYALIETMNSIGSESKSAERVRKHREIKKNEQKVLQCNATETIGNTEIEIEIEKELELELDIKQELVKDNVQSEIERHFDEFWKFYPNKKAKKTALVSYTKIIKAGKYNHEHIMNGLMLYLDYIKATNTQSSFIAHPTTYLNQERFNDELVLPNNNNQQKNIWEEIAYEPAGSEQNYGNGRIDVQRLL